MSKKVIDLSEHNGNIDFNIFKNNGIDSLILRIGWIGNHNNHTIDKKLDNYISQCRNIGFNFGLYVYSYCNSLDSIKSAIIWIDNILKRFNIKSGTPIFLDLEDNSISNISKEELTQQAEYFCSYYKLKGYNSGVYANKYWFDKKLDVNRLLNYKIWLAEWEVNSPTVSYKVDIWQFTSKYNINGKNYDCSYCYCDNCDGEDTGGEFEVKQYINGSTTEYVYQDAECTKQIGYLHPREVAECYGIVDNRALVVYHVDGTNNKKSGFCKWLGGIK